MKESKEKLMKELGDLHPLTLTALKEMAKDLNGYLCEGVEEQEDGDKSPALIMEYPYFKRITQDIIDITQQILIEKWPRNSGI